MLLTNYGIIPSKGQSDAKLTSVQSAGGVLYYDSLKATGSGLPTNDPWIGILKDLITANANDATLNNFSHNTTSGWDVSDTNKPFLIFDGVDDACTIVKSSSLNITSAPIAIGATIKIASNKTCGIFNVWLSELANAQYLLAYSQTTAGLRGVLNGTIVVSSNAIMLNTWYSVLFILYGTTVKLFINGVQSGSSGSFSGSLTERPFVKIGTLNGVYGNFKLANLFVASGENCTEEKALAAVAAISEPYLVA